MMFSRTRALPLLLAALLWLPAAALGERRYERRPLFDPAPTYLVSLPEGAAQALWLGLPGTGDEEKPLLAVLDTYVPPETLLVVAPAVPGEVVEGGFLPPAEVGADAAMDDGIALATAQARRALEAARKDLAPGVEAPVTVVALRDAAAAALALARDHSLRIGRVILIAPELAGQLSDDDAEAMADLKVDAFVVSAAHRRAADRQAEELRARLGRLGGRSRVFAARMLDTQLLGLVVAALDAVEGLRIYDRARGEKLTFEALADALAKRDVIFLGEAHDNAVTHRIEARLLEALHARRSTVALGLEMFERDVQGVLDDYLAGKIEEPDFLRRSRPWPNYRSDYRPLIELAKARGLPVVAGNLPRHLARHVGQEGLEDLASLEPADRAFAAREPLVLDDAYRRNFERTMAGIDDQGMVARFYAAQCLKDDTMAESAADFLAAHPERRPYLHVNGAFHTDHRLGTAQKLARLRPELDIAVVSCQPCPNPSLAKPDDAEADLADYVIFVPAEAPEPEPRAGHPMPHAKRETKAPDPPAPPEPAEPAEEEAPTEAESEGVCAIHIEVSLRPEEHFLKAHATLDLTAEEVDSYPRGGAAFETVELPLSMAADLRPRKVQAWTGERSLAAPELASAESPGGNWMLAVAVPHGQPLRLAIEYEGQIHDPVERDEAKPGHTGESTSGTVGPEGVFLGGGSGWYPAVRGIPMYRFSLDARVPAPFLIVSQGDAAERSRDGDIERVVYRNRLPTPSLALMAGPYAVKSKATKQGVAVSAYLFAEEARFADVFLDAAVGYIEHYHDLIGPYPYGKFDIVENFFSTGWGMPSLTLMGQQLLRMGPGALRPGMLDHEVLHSWWGCSVHGDDETGNWCEALTTYLANHHMREVSSDPDDARRQRRQSVLSYNVDTADKQTYPLREFRWRQDEVAAAIGYAKGQMVFHDLRRRVGDERFCAALRDFYAAHKGRVAGWSDLIAAFDRHRPEGMDLGHIWEQWLDREDVPELELQALPPAEDEAEQVFRIHQRNETPYDLTVTLSLAGGAEARRFEVRFDGPSAEFRAPRGTRATLDPDFHLIRKLDRDAWPPCVATLLRGEPLTVILPSGADERAREAFRKVAVELQASSGVRIVEDTDVDAWVLATGSVLILGTPQQNKAYERLAADGLADLFPSDPQRRPLLRDRELPADADLLISLRHPRDPGQVLTAYLPYSEQGVERTRMIFHYRWDGAVVFQGGRAVERIDEWGAGGKPDR